MRRAFREVAALALCRTVASSAASQAGPTAYNMFFKDRAKDLKAPGQKVGDLARAISEEYRKLSPEELARYRSESERLKGGPRAPKTYKGPSAWSKYISKNFAAVKSERGGQARLPEVMRELSARWRAMDEAGKAIYKQQYKQQS